MAWTLIGKNFTPPDIRAKVTGQAKYAEDFRVDGMVFARMLTSPIPHAQIRSIDASEALAMEGVFGILTADDEGVGDLLTNEPRYVGDPILAVAAVDETTAENAIERIRLDFEALPFTVDPLESLYRDRAGTGPRTPCPRVPTAAVPAPTPARRGPRRWPRAPSRRDACRSSGMSSTNPAIASRRARVRYGAR